MTAPSEEALVLSTSFPPFLEKLQQLVRTCEPEYGYWSENGRQFIVCSDEFEEKVLKKYFKGSLKTFIRQLHFYCFKKSEAVGGKWSFSHPSFQRDRPDLARHIKRKTRLNSTSFASKVELDALRTVVYDLKAKVEAELHSVRAQLGSIFKILNDLQRVPDASKFSTNSGATHSDSSGYSLSNAQTKKRSLPPLPFYPMQSPPQFNRNGQYPQGTTFLPFPSTIHPQDNQFLFPGINVWQGAAYQTMTGVNPGVSVQPSHPITQTEVGSRLRSKRNRKRKRRRSNDRASDSTKSSTECGLPLDDASFQRFSPGGGEDQSQK